MTKPPSFLKKIRALAIILSNDHPARGIARNLFYLSRMIELGGGQAEAAAGIATEIDLARLWWRYGGVRGEDDGRFARLKVTAGDGHSSRCPSRPRSV
jgi:hypothetical protein